MHLLAMGGAVVFLFFIGLVAVRGKYEPICQPTSARNAAMSPKLPDIPSAFSTTVEGNFVNKNYTAIFKEYYDFAANKGALERTKAGKTNRSIYNYDQDERILVNVDSRNCSVLPIDELRNHCKFSFFGNNNSRIETVADLFRFTGNFKDHYSYLGTTSVRGVKCNHWRGCFALNLTSFYLDYYFSIPGWGTAWESPNSTVVRAIVNGTSQNTACNTNGTRKVINGTHDFYHVYDFFNFRAGRPDSSYFQLPEGYYCVGLKGPNKTLPVIPPVFSMEVEGVFNSQSHVQNWQEVYDFEKKLVMVKGSNWWNPNLGPVVQIHDFNTGIGYNMSTPNKQNQHGCHLFNITDKTWDATDAGNHHIRMKTTQELFNSQNGNQTATIVYKGVSSIREIEADVWVSNGISRRLERNNKSQESVVEWYFSKPSWNLSSGFAVRQHQVPLKMAVYSQRGKVSMNVFNFDAEPVESTVFDIKPCFSPDQQVYIQFTLKGGKYDYLRWRNFMLVVIQSISSAAGVSLIRVNGMRLSYVGQGNIIVTFTLLGKPAFQPPSVEQPSSEKALKEALDALKNSVESGNFKVKFNNEILQAERTSFFRGYKDTPSGSPVFPTDKPSDKPQPGGGGPSKKKGVPGGAVAGVAFVMLAVGILGGLGIAHVIMKRRGTSLFQYQRHE